MLALHVQAYSKQRAGLRLCLLIIVPNPDISSSSKKFVLTITFFLRSPFSDLSLQYFLFSIGPLNLFLLT
jgi:hypothetical protein